MSEQLRRKVTVLDCQVTFDGVENQSMGLPLRRAVVREVMRRSVFCILEICPIIHVAATVVSHRVYRILLLDWLTCFLPLIEYVLRENALRYRGYGLAVLLFTTAFV